MEDDERLEKEGNAIISVESERIHQVKQWAHEEAMAKIACKYFGLADVVGYCFVTAMAAIAIMCFIFAAGAD